MVSRTGEGELEFRFNRPGAREVFLVGDFNGWNPRSQPMKRTKEGEWFCRVKLPEGVYEFRYLADEEWYVDYAAFGVEPSPFGYNSVMVIDDAKVPAMPLG